MCDCPASDEALPIHNMAEAVCRAWWPNHWPDVPDPEGQRRLAREAVAVVYVKARVEGEAARKALSELVALKDGPRDAEYERRKSLAWQAAREVTAHFNPEAE